MPWELIDLDTQHEKFLPFLKSIQPAPDRSRSFRNPSPNANAAITFSAPTTRASSGSRTGGDGAVEMNSVSSGRSVRVHQGRHCRAYFDSRCRGRLSSRQGAQDASERERTKNTSATLLDPDSPRVRVKVTHNDDQQRRLHPSTQRRRRQTSGTTRRGRP